ncbi:facilitated trehalose transporter Tret1 [Microplitis demolitor]|uniref:facilitated trehalose transporter Tret1 n=1 Tax=Microplitis demolitor TaxID=69319 RepID=UPI0004CD0E29|nr:facilitated trehalose transporter Tret1 [Microplitis demolitor]
MKSKKTMEVTKSMPPEEPGKYRQFLVAIIVNISSLVYGIMIGWASPTIPLLKSAETPVGQTPLNDDQVSWLISIMCLGGVIVLPLCGWISEKFGRKITGYTMGIPYVTCWLLTLFATNYWYLLIARVFAGFGGAICFFLVPMYVAETAGDSIRGQLGSLMVFSVNIGILMGYVLGAVMSYQLFAISSLILPMVFLGSFAFLPETPSYLVRKDRMNDAAKSLMWLKNGDKSAADRELLRLQSLVKESSDVNEAVGLRDLFRDKATIKGLVIGIMLLCGQQTCGISAMLSYTAMIFQIAGSSLSPNSATIIVGAIQIFGSWLSTVLMERAGRRPLILISCMGMLVCHFILGLFLYLQYKSYDVTSFGWIPLLALSVYAVVYCVGMGPAPFIVAAEVFSPDVASLANTVNMICLFISAFLVMKLFPLLIVILGIYGCFFFLGACCGCTFLFTLFFVPETKGRSIESILDELNGLSGQFKENGYVKAAVDVNEKNLQSSNV